MPLALQAAAAAAGAVLLIYKVLGIDDPHDERWLIPLDSPYIWVPTILAYGIYRELTLGARYH
jgi:hypothetical protein